MSFQTCEDFKNATLFYTLKACRAVKLQKGKNKSLKLS